MGTKIPVAQDAKSGVLFIEIPERHIPQIEIEELPERKTVDVEVVIYGGAGATLRPGIEGRYPIPLDMTITHVYKNGEWIDIPETPMGRPGKRREGVWRSQIPAHIYKTYLIRPGMYIRIAFKTITKDFKVAINYQDIILYARWYPAYRSAYWIIPQELKDYPTIKRGFDLGIVFGDIYTWEKQICVDFVFPGIERQLIREFYGGYRSSAVINISLKKTKKYEFTCDIRTQWLSVLPKLYVLDSVGNRIKTTEAGAWTNKNLLDAHIHLINIRAGLKTGEITKKDKKGRILGIFIRREPELIVEGEITPETKHMKEYIGVEDENNTIGVAETYLYDAYGEMIDEYDFDYAYKTIEFPIRMAIYDNRDVEGTIPTRREWRPKDRIWRDINGLVWKRRKGQRTIYEIQ